MINALYDVRNTNQTDPCVINDREAAAPIKIPRENLIHEHPDNGEILLIIMSEQHNGTHQRAREG